MDDLERHRRELTGYCYRMLGSGFEAEDAVQETMVRAWRGAASFEGRSSVRSWMYRIATNVCLDMLRGRKRRSRPMEMGPSMRPEPESLAAVLPEQSWVSPIADDRILPAGGDPAEVAAARESIKLAFVAALQHLPPRQRAALILCEVLRWQASEAADLLDTTVPAINSALQRARSALAPLRRDDGTDDETDDGATPSAAPALDAQHSDLLARYVDAFERYDMEALVALLREDAVQSMPPYALWLDGADDIVAWMLGVGRECEGSRLLVTRANGTLACGQYRSDGHGGHRPWALQVLEVDGGRISEIHAFLDPALFPAFGLPAELPAQ
ncbi:sigma-70 family RNA polymerase sigma factor [Acidiferrimicrobium sp. IK]|nr:sigma-70 family RNA polymerase sigma factor [Acidiferrimicrobium sp. IK]